MTYFWAKTTPEGKPGTSVYEHMIHVGCVARCIAETRPEELKRFNLLPSEIGALAALHDLGKICPGFQRKCEEWLLDNRLGDIAIHGNWENATETDHGKVSHAAIQDFLHQQGCPPGSAKYLAAALAGHHGKIKYSPNDRGIKPPLIRPTGEGRSGLNWDLERSTCAQEVLRYFQVGQIKGPFSVDTPGLWWLAGMTAVADWIGSDERYFSPQLAAGADVSELARRALEGIGFTPAPITGGLTFEDLFEFDPNDMQKRALAAITAPGVYIIEAPMGMGKTEAALGAAYSLLSSGQANGIYFALPTQATSNRIHLRLNDFISRISPTTGPSRLIHSNSWLMREALDYQPVPTERRESSGQDARVGRDWFASPRRAILSPFGVGTIDQTLLGVVASKHFFVRHFALAGKVVILDEVHSYDVYTGTLIDKLVDTLEQLGCTVIVLSATLTGRRRSQILTDHNSPSDAPAEPYPLISGRKEGLSLEPIAAFPPPTKTISVDFIDHQKAEDEAVALAREGGAVLWICNTVGAAQAQFRHLVALAGEKFKVGLLHSRMIFSHREAREQEWMTRFGKNGGPRCGSILVSTQIVEQSVDLDADLLVTELAPTDMLLQRTGRLWRHERGARPCDRPRMYILREGKPLEELRTLPEAAIIDALGRKAKVYSPYVLLRSLEAWQAQPTIIVPEDIRRLLDMTYRETDAEPSAWQQLYNRDYAESAAYRQKALAQAKLWQPPLDDQEGAQTRLNELPTMPLILCRQIAGKRVGFLDGSEATVSESGFDFVTAKAVHRNLVKVPAYHFAGQSAETIFSECLRETHLVGLVGDDGVVSVRGLKEGIMLTYFESEGLVIDRPRGEETA